MEGMAQVAKLIGRRGWLKVPALPWRVEVVVVDVRSRFGTIDLRVGKPYAEGDRADSQQADTTWVERNRVEV